MEGSEDAQDGAAVQSFYAVLNVAPEASDEDVKRAYRTLAQTCHPDKHTDPEMQALASQQFARLQQAYEVLIDPQKRQVYDIYGLEGLTSGLQVGSHLRSREELRQEWERFKAQQEREQEESEVNYRGVCICKIDASSTVLPPRQRQPSSAAPNLGPFLRYGLVAPQAAAGDAETPKRRLPEITSIAMNSSMSVAPPFMDDTVATVGGQVGVRRNMGGGSFLCGLKRNVSQHSTVEVHAMAGLKQLLVVQSTRQLSPHTSATVAASWQPELGLGLQVSSTRQLSEHASGEFSWVVGPSEAAGMALSLSWRGERYMVSGKLDVGAVTGISGRYVRNLTERTSGRLAVRVGSTGVELEVGATHRLSDFSVAGASVIAGLAGVSVKAHFSRGGQQFIFPVLLSRQLDLRVLAAAYLLPPALTLVGKYYVYKPLQRRYRLKKALEARRETVGAVQLALALAADAQRLQRPVAHRKLAKEAGQGGLVVVEAVYGVLASAPPAASLHTTANGVDEAASVCAEAQPGVAQPEHGGEASSPEGAFPSPSGPDPSSAEGHGVPAGGGGEEEEEELQAAAAARRADSILESAHELPPQWLDVTAAVRFQVENGLLTFHPGVKKAGLMGFCDVAPGATRQLRIVYLWRHKPFQAVLGEEEGATLPSAGVEITDDELVSATHASVQEQGIPTSCPAEAAQS